MVSALTDERTHTTATRLDSRNQYTAAHNVDLDGTHRQIESAILERANLANDVSISSKRVHTLIPHDAHTSQNSGDCRSTPNSRVN